MFKKLGFRMKKKCLFCNSTVLSREHIYPEWLTKAFTPTSKSFTPNAFLQLVELVGDNEKYHIKSDISDGRKINYSDFVVKSVCATCNNGWMSDFEQKVKEVLLSTERIYLNCTLDTQTATDLALWAILKSVLISSSAQIPTEWSESTLELIKNKVIPEGFLVELTTLDSTNLDFRIGNQTVTIPKFLSKEDMEFALNDFFICCFQILNIGIRVSHLRTNIPAYRAQAVKQLYICHPYKSSLLFLPHCIINYKDNSKEEKTLTGITTIDNLYYTLFLFG